MKKERKERKRYSRKVIGNAFYAQQSMVADPRRDHTDIDADIPMPIRRYEDVKIQRRRDVDADADVGTSSSATTISDLLVTASAGAAAEREEVKVNNASATEMKHACDDALKRVSSFNSCALSILSFSILHFYCLPFLFKLVLRT